MMDARISIGLPSHPKTKKLVRKLGGAGAWKLVCLFLWVAANRPDGDLAGLSEEDIELSVDWDGGEGSFVKALLAVGFLDGIEGAYRIHDWAEHNPWAAGAEARAEKSKWLALCKHHGRAKAAEMMPDYAARIQKAADSKTSESSESATSTDKPATSMRHAENSSAPSPSPSPLPSPNTSEANASGGEPPKVTDPDEIIFGYGVPLLTNAGTSDKSARSFLGGLRKQHGDAALIDKLRECIRAKPLQPLEWLAAALPPASAGPPRNGGRTMPAAENFASKDYGTGGLL